MLGVCAKLRSKATLLMSIHSRQRMRLKEKAPLQSKRGRSARRGRPARRRARLARRREARERKVRERPARRSQPPRIPRLVPPLGPGNEAVHVHVHVVATCYM